MPSCVVILDEDGRIGAEEEIDADAVTDAIHKALTMVQQQPRHRSMEIWAGAKRLYPPARTL